MSLELRYGMWHSTPRDLASSLRITVESSERDALMLCASFSAAPATPLVLMRSLPARSTRLKHAERLRVMPSSSPLSLVASTMILKMQCDRDDWLFIAVALTARRAAAAAKTLTAASADATGRVVMFSMKTAPFFVCRTRSPAPSQQLSPSLERMS